MTTAKRRIIPQWLWAQAEKGAWLDLSPSHTSSDTAGTTPAEVGQGIANADDRSPNDADSVQATSTARPIFARVPRGGRRNLLTHTEDFSNAVWLKQQSGSGAAPVVTPNYGPDPDGAMVADRIQFNAGDGFSRVFRNGATQPDANHINSIFLRSADGVSEYTIGFNNGNASSVITVTGSYQRFAIKGTTTTNNFQLICVSSGATSVEADILAVRAQTDASALPTPYQKVTTQYDITETGVDSIYHAVYDLTDDISPVTLPAITGGTVALIGLNGIWIEEDWDYAGGTLSIGPTTIAGLPAGILSVVGGLCAVIINDRAWTAAERAAVIAWGKARGAPGAFSLGPELVTNGTFDTDTAWTKGAGWTISAGAASCDGTQITNSLLNQSIAATTGANYRCELTVSGYTAGFLRLQVGSQTIIGATTTNGTAASVSPAYTSGPGIAYVVANAEFVGSVDNISVRKLVLTP